MIALPNPLRKKDLQQTLTQYLGSKLKKKNQSAQEVKKSIREFDLTYLIKASDNNQEFIQEIINTFLESMPKTIEEIQIQLQRKNWEHLAKVVHKLNRVLRLWVFTTLKKK